jgi:hypothetical protein
VLSVQRNEEFNVITTQSQEFNRGRCARNMFSEKIIGSVQNIMVDEGMEEIQMRKKIVLSLVIVRLLVLLMI